MFSWKYHVFYFLIFKYIFYLKKENHLKNQFAGFLEIWYTDLVFYVGPIKQVFLL